MKKLLIVALTFSFCAADAGVWSKLKSKIKGTSSQQTQQTDAIGAWISNVQGILTNMTTDVQEVANSVMSWEIQNAVTGLNTTLTACYADPFKIFASKSAIDEYINTLKEKTQSNTQTVNIGKLLTDYQNLSSVITSYNTSYSNNIDSILTTAKNIQTGWNGNPEISGYANQLITLLEACKSDLTKVSSNLENIKQYVSQLSGKLGANHMYVTALNNGIVYLQTHVELQQRSANLTSASAQTTATTSSSKLNTVINVINTVKNLRNSSSNTTTGTTSTSTGGVNYQNLLNTGMNLYNQYKSANSGTQTNN